MWKEVRVIHSEFQVTLDFHPLGATTQLWLAALTEQLVAVRLCGKTKAAPMLAARRCFSRSYLSDSRSHRLRLC